MTEDNDKDAKVLGSNNDDNRTTEILFCIVVVYPKYSCGII